MFDLGKLKLTLEAVLGGGSYDVIAVSPYYEYVEGKRSDTVLGQKYTVGIGAPLYCQVAVKVPKLAPIFDNKEIESSGGSIPVTFKNGVASFYRTPNGGYDITFSAEKVDVSDSMDDLFKK